MSLPTNKPPMADIFLAEGTTSIGATPVPAVLVVPAAGLLRKVWAAAGGTTTGTITVAVTINGVATDVAGGNLTLAAGTGARNGSSGVKVMDVGVNAINLVEGDVITFTPSGGGGASIPGAFGVAIRPQ